MGESIRLMLGEVKEDFLNAKYEEVMELFNYSFINFSLIVGNILLLVVYFQVRSLGFSLMLLLNAIGLVCVFSDKAFTKAMAVSSRVLFHFFGRYGKVVTKEDWNYINEVDHKLYREIWAKDNIGHCYYTSLRIALLLENAEIMYCSIEKDDGTQIAHSVILKDNYVYDTNGRVHFTLEQYVQLVNAKIYKVFSIKEYGKTSFLEDVRDEFVSWCKENNVKY